MKPKEDLTGGTVAAKTSTPLCDRSGAAGTGAPEELKLDGRFLQEDKTKVRTRRGVQQQKKIGKQLIDVGQGAHHRPHPPHSQAKQP